MKGAQGRADLISAPFRGFLKAVLVAEPLAQTTGELCSSGNSLRALRSCLSRCKKDMQYHLSTANRPWREFGATKHFPGFIPLCDPKNYLLLVHPHYSNSPWSGFRRAVCSSSPPSQQPFNIYRCLSPHPDSILNSLRCSVFDTHPSSFTW